MRFLTAQGSYLDAIVHSKKKPQTFLLVRGSLKLFIVIRFYPSNLRFTLTCGRITPKSLTVMGAVIDTIYVVMNLLMLLSYSHPHILIYKMSVS